MVNSARYFGIYDTEVILSWMPSEYLALMKGVQLREIDDLERLAIGALFTAKAQNSKRISLKKLFDADKARRKIEEDQTDKQIEIDRAMKLNEAFKGFKPQFVRKEVNK